MSWELAYLFGLLSGGALAGLVGVFLHARSWADWSEAYDAMHALACDWRNRFGAESKRVAILDMQLAALADDLAGCRRRNAEADKEILAIAGFRARDLADATLEAEAMATVSESLRSQLADTHKTLDAAMAHVEQLVMKRDAGIVERDSLLTQIRGLHEAVQAVTDLRNDAAARADASNARCQHAFRDRAKTHQKMREIIALTDALRAEANS